jgi:single-stranded-DNA-specific exonuclease
LRDPRTRGLERARDEVRLALRQSLTVPPLVRGEAALIRLSTPYGVHPLVAAAWKRRLAPRVVLVANDGYLPGRVNFAVRGGGGDLRRLLRSALPEANGEFAHGHDRATGGSLRPHDFERLLDALGLAA